MLVLIFAGGGDAAPELPPPPPSGLLVLDARPWARLIDVVDATGQSPIGPAPEAYTPLRLELPPGTYRMRLATPDGSTVELPLQIVSGRTVTRVETFGTVDLEPLWERLGWAAAPAEAESGEASEDGDR